MEDDSASRSPAELERIEKLWSRADFGATWFFWIPAISAVQAVLIPTMGLMMPGGLKACLLVDLYWRSWADENGFRGFAMMVLVQWVIAAPLALIGYLATKRHLWAYLVGAAMLAGDGALFVIWGLEFRDNQLGLLVRLVVLVLVGWGLVARLQVMSAAGRRGPTPLLGVPENHPSRKDDLFNDPERLRRG